MGTWGPGVFQNDFALDFIGAIDAQLIQEMRSVDREGFDFIDLATVLAAAALLAVHYENFAGGLPDEVDVREWERKCLEVYDREIDEYTNREEHKAARRAVIVNTFQKLQAVHGQRPRMDL